MKKIIYLLLLITLISCHKTYEYKSEEMYTIEDCKHFSVGDTIYTREFHKIKKCVVIKNIPDLNLIEVHDLEYEYTGRKVLKYDEFRFF